MLSIQLDRNAVESEDVKAFSDKEVRTEKTLFSGNALSLDLQLKELFEVSSIRIPHGEKQIPRIELLDIQF